jgi:hypothetical protein
MRGPSSILGRRCPTPTALRTFLRSSWASSLKVKHAWSGKYTGSTVSHSSFASSEGFRQLSYRSFLPSPPKRIPSLQHMGRPPVLSMLCFDGKKAEHVRVEASMPGAAATSQTPIISIQPLSYKSHLAAFGTVQQRSD